jgi:hypothetical protein
MTRGYKAVGDDWGYFPGIRSQKTYYAVTHVPPRFQCRWVASWLDLGPLMMPKSLPQHHKRSSRFGFARVALTFYKPGQRATNSVRVHVGDGRRFPSSLGDHDDHDDHDDW